jgi:flavodoxin
MEERTVKSLVVYVTHKGDTRRVADEIGEVLGKHGPAEVIPADEAPPVIGPDVDLLVVGGPTEGHGMTPEQRAYLDRLVGESIRGRRVAAFDTRLKWPRLLSGSAADAAAERLANLGARVVEPHGSFLVSTAPELLPGELDRARDWAANIARDVVAVPA